MSVGACVRFLASLNDTVLGLFTGSVMYIQKIFFPLFEMSNFSFIVLMTVSNMMAIKKIIIPSNVRV